MTKQALVSVVIPTHNRWPQVCEAIDSVLSQTWTDIECVVVDDCSTDHTETGVKERYGNRVIYIKNSSNREKSFSRNRGAIEAGGEYVCFLDSDDLLTPNSIAARMASLTDGIAKVVWGVTQRPGESTQSALAKFSELDCRAYSVERYLAKPGLLSNNAYLLSRQDFLASGMYTEQLTNMEDVSLFIRLLCRYPVILLNEIVTIVQVSEASARRAYGKIIAQYPSFSTTLLKDEGVRNQLSLTHQDKLCALDHTEYLIALYRSGKFVDYIKQYRRLILSHQHQMPIGSRFKKRYWFARLLSIPSAIWPFGH